MRRRRLPLLAALLVAGLGLSSATAQEPSAQELAQDAFRLSREGDHESAIENYRRALEVDPELNGARFALARLYATAGRFEESRQEFSLLVLINPEDSASRRGEVTALTFLDRWPEARRKLEEGLSALPRDGQLAHLLARVLASAPDDAVRDGALALQLATKVYEVQKIPVVQETVAMALAETGQFEQAIEIQTLALDELTSAGTTQGQDLARRRLQSYADQKPWRVESPVEIVLSTELPTGRL